MSKGKRVVIIGAGPTGLVTALGLARKGAQVTVIDREDDILRWPRAMVYLPSTLKVLDEIGLLERAKEVGAYGYEFNLRFPLTGNIGRLSYKDLEGHTPYAYNLHFGQDILAEIVLTEFLALPGTEIRWKTSFDSIEQSEDCVQVAVHTPNGPRTIEADWVVGADGARSSVRKDLGVDFEGFTWEDTFMATNVYYDFDKYGYAPSTMIAGAENWAVIAKINDQGYWRIAYGEDSSLSEEERVARIKERYKSFLPDLDAPCEMVMANSYRVHQRSAKTYRVGRVMLAGDAAHATNPIGGMGFTSGVQDADTLIKCLGGVINGELNEDALDWYSYERRRCFLEIANPTAIEFKRRTQERDTQKRMQDEANMFELMKDKDMCKQALLSTFSLTGRPYRQDWRETYLVQDALGEGSQGPGHGGINIH
ncbi:FAD-dependent oxidoreductase [Pseudomonas sp. TWI672]|uniref:FAD-dependent oxidoreductase n=1 Tax=unclassified Pseudomonas TaxID=196821 RepID=UPI003209260E